jgi:transcriptional regulator GlxA family with amidase domain
MKQRLTRASELIETTDMSVKEVAFAVGFKQQSHFSRVFRRVFGRPPLQYQQAIVRQQERANL